MAAGSMTGASLISTIAQLLVVKETKKTPTGQCSSPGESQQAADEWSISSEGTQMTGTHPAGHESALLNSSQQRPFISKLPGTSANAQHCAPWRSWLDKGLEGI